LEKADSFGTGNTPCRLFFCLMPFSKTGIVKKQAQFLISNPRFFDDPNLVRQAVACTRIDAIRFNRMRIGKARAPMSSHITAIVWHAPCF
jgi:hypothetical protein